MKPSQLYHAMDAIIAETCGCEIAWDLDREGNKLTTVTPDQMVEIYRRMSDIFWPEGTREVEVVRESANLR